MFSYSVCTLAFPPHTHTHTLPSLYLLFPTSPHMAKGDSSCDASCAPGAGCLGPNNSTLCGTCRRLEDNSNTCDTVPVPLPGGVDATAITLGIIIPLLIIVLAVLTALGIWGGVVLSKKWRRGRKGSFDIVVSSSVA